MATYNFSPVPAWGQAGSFARIGAKKSTTFPCTLPGGGSATVVQSGTTKVGYVESDANGLIPAFTTTDIPSVDINFGVAVLRVNSAEAITSGASSAAAAASSATDAANSASAAASSASDAAATVASKVSKGELFVVDTDHASLEDALDATATGGTLEIRSAWTRVLPFTVSKTCTVRFARTASITTTSATIAAITVTANDVYLDGPRLFGTGSATSSTGVGIAATGTLASPITGLRIRGPKCQDFTYVAVNLTFCQDFSVERVRIDNIAYGGVMMASCTNGIIDGGTIKNITQPAGLVNSYGVAASYDGTAGIATNPQSRDIIIRNLTVDGVPNWEGIDTHAGINIQILNNTVRNCRSGIAIVPGQNGSASIVLAPKNILVSGNTIDSGYTDGRNTVGINFVGCSSGLGFHNNIDWATGRIVNNTIIECGNDAATSGCALNAQDTLGLVISGNTFTNPVVSAIKLDYNNKDAVVQGNTAADVWTNTAAFAAMIQTYTWNTVKATGNVLTRGTKSATTVNSVGLRVNSALATVVVEQGNDFLAATAPYSLATPLIRFDQHGVRSAFVTALPTSGVWQPAAQAINTAPAAAGSPGWVCTTAGGASSATWAATTAYSASVWIKTSTGKVLECAVGGTSSGTEPAPSTLDGTFTDGTVTWVYRSATSAVFKAMPSIAA